METQKAKFQELASLFSRTQALRWAKGDFSGIKSVGAKHVTYFDFLQQAYAALLEGYPNEYVVKNEFLNSKLLKTVWGPEAKVYSEFRVGKSIADLAIFSTKTSSAIEVKTELDTDQRLDSQIESYESLFNFVSLIVPKSKLELYKKVKRTVGIIVYDFSSPTKFSIYRSATHNDKPDPKAVMQALHTDEYKAIVQRHYGKLPPSTSFTQYDVCSELIGKIPPHILTSYFVECVRSRKTSNVLSFGDHLELTQMCLSFKMGDSQRSKLIADLSQTQCTPHP